MCFYRVNFLNADGSFLILTEIAISEQFPYDGHYDRLPFHSCIMSCLYIQCFITISFLVILNMINFFPVYHVDTFRPRQNGRQFADNIFKFIFFNENRWTLIGISFNN